MQKLVEEVSEIHDVNEHLKRNKALPDIYGRRSLTPAAR
jgi:hypothetical protein